MANVLIVDDEPSICSLIAYRLTQNGYVCEEASNGKAALAKLQHFAADVVVSDIMMPELTGIGLLQALREAGSNVPFICLSGFATRALTVQGLRLGAFDFVEKPFDLEALALIVGQACQTQETVSPKKMSPTEHWNLRVQARRHCRTGSNEVNGNTPPQLVEAFVQEAMVQFQLCVSSIQSLHSPEMRAIELAYLLRVVQTSRRAAEHLKLDLLVSLLTALEECYVKLRLWPEIITDEIIALMLEANDAMKTVISLTGLEGISPVDREAEFRRLSTLSGLIGRVDML